MDHTRIFEISASGMQFQKLRLEVAARNLANAQSSFSANGVAIYPLQVVSVPTPQRSQSVNFESAFDDARLNGVSGTVIQSTLASPRLVHEPGHPHADETGIVRYAGIDHLGQMVALAEALRMYDANLAAFSAAKTMATRALDIGGQS